MYPSATAWKSESLPPDQVICPPPIQYILRPQGSLVSEIDSENTRLPNVVTRMPLISLAGMGGRLTFRSVSLGKLFTSTIAAIRFSSQGEWLARLASRSTRLPAKDTAMPGIPSD